MNLVRSTDALIIVTLSRRNLETLLKCLDNAVAMPSLNRIVNDDGLVLLVKAEENAEHYASDARQEAERGKMDVGPEDVP